MTVMNAKTLKIVSGGQTGADRGGLEAALDLGTPYDGWVPKGRRSEDGQVPEQFKLREHANPDYPPRTWANVRDSDGTVIICNLPMSGGSKLTMRYCHEQEKPVMVRDAKAVMADPDEAARQLVVWIRQHNVGTLNVAGSRESSCRGLQAAVKQTIRTVLLLMKEGEPA